MPLVVTIRDASGFLNCAWFNQPYLARVLKRGQRLIVHGKVQRYRSGPLQMQVKDFAPYIERFGLEPEAGDSDAA